MSTNRPSPAISRVLAKAVGLGKRIEQTTRGWKIQCPAPGHEDERPSCDIDLGKDGCALMICRSKGCAQQEMLTGLGLQKKDLFLSPHELREWQGGGGSHTENDSFIRSDKNKQNKHNNLSSERTGERNEDNSNPSNTDDSDSTDTDDDHSAGLTLKRYSEAKSLPLGFLGQLGLSEITYLGKRALRIPYKDQLGNLMAVRFRLALKKSQYGDNRFSWRGKAYGDTLCLYGLWRWELLQQSDSIVLVGGESDSQTCWLQKRGRTCLPILRIYTL
jgi:hypothetical protein